MLRHEKLELAGPISVIGAIMCADLGAHALANWPTSSLLWYLNLEVFRSFRYSFAGFGAPAWLGADGLPQAVWVVAPLLGLVCIGLLVRNRLLLALASNLSLIYSAALLYGSVVANVPAPGLHLNLSGLATPSGVFAATILLVSILSTTISHWNYWREIFS
jgi:hypothetical protein